MVNVHNLTQKYAFVYIHGFASHKNKPNEKVDILRNEGYTVYCVGYEGSYPLEDFAHLREQISDVLNKETKDLVLIGTSLGGFYANLLGDEFDVKCIIINPALHPDVTMEPRVGEVFKNYHTGEGIYITNTTLAQYRNIKNVIGLRLEQTRNYRKKLVLLDSDDEVLDSKKTIEVYQGTEAGVLCFNGGNHRFQHMHEALEPIQMFISHYQG